MTMFLIIFFLFLSIILFISVKELHKYLKGELEIKIDKESVFNKVDTYSKNNNSNGLMFIKDRNNNLISIDDKKIYS